MDGCYIKGIEYYLPQKVELNEMSTSAIKQKIGIRLRHIAEKNEYASDLACHAANKVISRVSNKEDIDFLLYCTQSPDYIIPTTACILQSKIKLNNSCGALDFNLGCSGYVYGLSLAKGLIHSGQANNVLLITSDTLSKYINPKDKSLTPIFGDGATATIISKQTNTPSSIGEFVFSTDGNGAENLIIPAGGLKQPIDQNSRLEKEDHNGNVRSDANLYMNGPEIFKYAFYEVPLSIKRFIDKENLKMEDYDYFVFHQANHYMMEMIRRKLDIPKGKFSIQIEDGGNTGSSSIPIALKREVERKSIKNGDRVMLVGFGVGYSLSICSIVWNCNN